MELPKGIISKNGWVRFVLMHNKNLAKTLAGMLIFWQESINCGLFGHFQHGELYGL
jgi:hypothetical protein